MVRWTNRIGVIALVALLMGLLMGWSAAFGVYMPPGPPPTDASRDDVDGGDSDPDDFPLMGGGHWSEPGHRLGGGGHPGSLFLDLSLYVLQRIPH